MTPTRVSIGIFILSALYSLALQKFDKVGDNTATVIYILASCLIYFQIVPSILNRLQKEEGRDDKKSTGDRKIFFSSSVFLILLTLSAPIGLALPTWLTPNLGENFFWVIDSVTTHVPASLKIQACLTGDRLACLHLDIFESGFLSHLWVSLFFFILGPQPTATLVAMTLLKCLTCVLIAKSAQECFQNRFFSAATLPYLASPCILFYTTVYYKEAMVHFLVALAFYSYIKYRKNPSGIYALSLGLSTLGLLSDRYYLGLLIAPLLIYLSLKTIGKNWFISTLTLTPAILIYINLRDALRWRLNDILNILYDLRLSHIQSVNQNNGSSDLNYGIPYPLAVIKTVLTPIWNTSKMDMFLDFSSLITWGAFIHWVLISTFILGVYYATRNLGRWHLIAQLPFILFILACAYISPWAGRIRDSFYPIISIYSFYGMMMSPLFKNHFPELRQTATPILQKDSA